MRKKNCFLALLLLPMFLYAQEQEQEPEQNQGQRQTQGQEQSQGSSFSFGNFSFSLTPRILQDGSMIDFSFGMLYSGSLSGEIQFRSTQSAKNEEISGADDSLNAVKETIYEVFLLPVQYRFVQKDNFRVMAGAGLYYEYDKLNEKGFFTLNFLEELDPPMERVNSYKNDFTMHLVGPLLDGKVSYNAQWFNFGFSAGIVPVFYAHFAQKLSMEPLLYPGAASLAEGTHGSPYFYFILDAIIAKYLNATFSFNYAGLTKKVIDVDDKLLGWIYPEQSVVNRSIMIEISALLPVGNGMSFQAGYGYMHNFISMDSDPAIEEGRHYLILSTKKTGF